jgi:hypothetical protein
MGAIGFDNTGEEATGEVGGTGEIGSVGTIRATGDNVGAPRIVGAVGAVGVNGVDSTVEAAPGTVGDADEIGSVGAPTGAKKGALVRVGVFGVNNIGAATIGEDTNKVGAGPCVHVRLE